MSVRFSAVMSLYEREEEEARRAVGRCERERAALLAEREAETAARLAAGSGLDPALHEQYLAFWEAVEGRLAALAGRLAGAEKALAQAREALIAAHRRTAAIAKLRELDRERARREGERREQRRTDEFASRRRAASA